MVTDQSPFLPKPVIKPGNKYYLNLPPGFLPKNCPSRSSLMYLVCQRPQEPHSRRRAPALHLGGRSTTQRIWGKWTHRPWPCWVLHQSFILRSYQPYFNGAVHSLSNLSIETDSLPWVLGSSCLKFPMSYKTWIKHAFLLSIGLCWLLFLASKVQLCELKSCWQH